MLHGPDPNPTPLPSLHSHSSSVDAAIRAITALIQENNLRPGDSLPSESDLGNRWNISRSSIREAIRHLVSLDVLEVRHGVGTFVGPMSLRPLVEGMVLRMTLYSADAGMNLWHVVEMRESLDLLNASELIEVFQTAPLDRLDDIVDSMQARFEAGESIIHEDHAFHNELAYHLRNPLMREFSLALWEIHMQTLAVTHIPAPSDIADTVNAHAQMVDALRNSDEDGYRELIKQHYRPLRDALSHVVVPENTLGLTPTFPW